MKFWHVLTVVAIVTACLYAQNHVTLYKNLTA